MQTKNLIQASTNVIKITSLQIGNVVKIVDEGYSTDIYYGVVIDLLNSGEKSFIQIMRYKKGYRDLTCDVKLYDGSKDLNLFPATKDEVMEHFKEAIDGFKKDIETKEKELANMKISFNAALEFVSNETSKKLTEASFKEITQSEYNQIKLEQKIIEQTKTLEIF